MGAKHLTEMKDALMVHMPDGVYLLGERVFASRSEFDAAEQGATREKALAKLTPEERRALGY